MQPGRRWPPTVERSSFDSAMCRWQRAALTVPFRDTISQCSFTSRTCTPEASRIRARDTQPTIQYTKSRCQRRISPAVQAAAADLHIHRPPFFGFAWLLFYQAVEKKQDISAKSTKRGTIFYKKQQSTNDLRFGILYFVIWSEYRQSTIWPVPAKKEDISTPQDLRCGTVETCRNAAAKPGRREGAHCGGSAVRVRKLWQKYVWSM